MDLRTDATPGVGQGRLCIVLAALMWSTSGAFTKALTLETVLGLHEPRLEGVPIACYRVLFAAAVVAPFLRRSDLSFQPRILPMVVCFAVMNVMFVEALTLGTSGTAIFLQYTAPMWMFLASVLWLGEPAERRSLVALAIGLAGIGVIVLGGWQQAQLNVVALGLGSGVAYAGVVIFLRLLRNASSRWLTFLNFLVSGLVLLPWLIGSPMPTIGQWICLFLYGGVQMAIPYWLMARGLKSVSPQEAGIITLLEPVLNPLWAYLVAGQAESPYTLLGGAIIVGALVWRYWPRRPEAGR